MSRNLVLLDLDGTLTKSDPGILTAVRYAYRVLNTPIPTSEELETFIGPPLIDSFLLHGFPQRQQALEGVDTYRHAYMGEAMFDDPHHPGQKIPAMYLADVYQGVFQALTDLHQAGYQLAIATCKPEPQTFKICDYFHIGSYCDGVYGASLDTSRIHKDQVIAYAFQGMGFNPDRGDRAIMVGDRWTDIDGGHAQGLTTVGVSWGYAHPGELAEHGAEIIIDKVSDLPSAVEQSFHGSGR